MPKKKKGRTKAKFDPYSVKLTENQKSLLIFYYEPSPWGVRLGLGALEAAHYLKRKGLLRVLQKGIPGRDGQAAEYTLTPKGVEVARVYYEIRSLVRLINSLKAYREHMENSYRVAKKTASKPIDELRRPLGFRYRKRKKR